MNDDSLGRLQEWYVNQCDGDWEHHEGIQIETLDNPGWFIKISLTGTDFEDRPVDPVQVDRTANDWLRVSKENGEWQAACGPLNLGEAIEVFIAWAATNSASSDTP